MQSRRFSFAASSLPLASPPSPADLLPPSFVLSLRSFCFLLVPLKLLLILEKKFLDQLSTHGYRAFSPSSSIFSSGNRQFTPSSSNKTFDFFTSALSTPQTPPPFPPSFPPPKYPLPSPHLPSTPPSIPRRGHTTNIPHTHHHVRSPR